MPLPAWSEFDEADLVDLTDELRGAFRARAIPEPRRVTSDLQELHDQRRYDVPVTVITCEFTTEQLLGWVAQGYPQVSELALIKDVEYVELPDRPLAAVHQSRPSSARRSWQPSTGASRLPYPGLRDHSATGSPPAPHARARPE